MTIPDLADIPPGFYGVPGRYNPDLVSLWRVSDTTWGDPALRAWPAGVQYGPTGRGRRRYLADIRAEILADPHLAAARYVLDAHRCHHCGTPIREPASLAAGIGPVCAPDVEPDRRAALAAAIARLTDPETTGRGTGARVLDRLPGDGRERRARVDDGLGDVQACEKCVIRPTNTQLNGGADAGHLIGDHMTGGRSGG